LKGYREEVVIATKFGHIVNVQEKVVYQDRFKVLPNVRTDIENSLRRLDTDYVDIYQLHDSGFSPDPALGLRRVLEDLVQDGKIRWYGWSTDNVDLARVFADGEHCTSIQFGLNAFYDNAEMRQLCTDFDLAGISKNPLSRGILTGNFTAASTFPADDVRSRVDFAGERIANRLKCVEALREVLTSGGRTMAQGALAYIWALDKRMLPIPGIKSVDDTEDRYQSPSQCFLLRLIPINRRWRTTSSRIGLYLERSTPAVAEMAAVNQPCSTSSLVMYCRIAGRFQ
jgi:aryl-alcohol dehydrogenase-like predicted oxidoreductase